MRHRLLEADLSGWADPERVFLALFADEPAVAWLDSAGPESDGAEGVSYLAAGSRLLTASVPRGTVTLDGVERPGEVLAVLDSELASLSVEPGSGFRLGWIGWLGYELRAQTVPMPATRESPTPDAALLFCDRAIAFDHARQRITLLALGDEWTGELAAWRDRLTAGIANAAETTAPDMPAPATAHWRYGDDEYLDMVVACQAAIAEGEAYQLCLTNEATLDIRVDPVAVYRRLRRASPSHHGSLFRAAGVTVVSSSPEQFLSVTPDGVVETKPIKGTRPRGADPAKDAALAAELEASEKERAENLMIVDLMRNDLARVSEVGSVSVPSLLAVESYPPVHQLVSAVRGQLRAGLSAVDAVASCFPAGSMTGAPKRRAMELLDALERRPRGIYSGALGYFGLDGRVDLAMVIRSIVLQEDRVTVGAGGGITALSVPEDELAEAKLKAAALLAALGAK